MANDASLAIDMIRPPAPLSVASEWRRDWPLVVAASAGASYATVALASFTFFLEPLEREFGWSRSEVLIGNTIYAVLTMTLSPVVGAMIDRWGSRRIAIPGLLLCSLAFAGFALANGSILQWIALWTVFAITAILVKVTVWTAAVSSVFAVSRGMAIAVTLCGTAIAQSLAPFFAQRLIDGYGWRIAYPTLALGWAAIAFVLVVAFFFDSRDKVRRHGETRPELEARPVQPGFTMKEAVRNPALLRIAAASFLFMIVAGVFAVHSVPILTERGLMRETAAAIIALVGLMGVVGKLVTGWHLDRSRTGKWIGGLTLATPSIGFLVFLIPTNNLLLIAPAAAAIGYSVGASLQVSVYLTGRYGGMRNFGKIFGITASLFAVATGIGPQIAALIYDYDGRYQNVIICLIPISLLSGYILTGLSGYPTWDSSGKHDRIPVNLLK